MSKLYGDDVELTEADASIVKGMIARGDKNETIASYFGVNQRAISHIRSKKKFVNVRPALAGELPPPGPYGVDPIYVRFYRTMVRVNQLWDARKMGEAKELFEKALRNPVFTSDLEAVDKAAAQIFRDEFGVSNFK